MVSLFQLAVRPILNQKVYFLAFACVLLPSMAVQYTRRVETTSFERVCL